MLKESAYGLGSTTWEVMSKVVLPYTKTGVVGAIMLGLGRALGETMAVTFVIGNQNQLNSLSLFEPANSITSALANEFAEAGEGLHQASLIYLGPGAVLHHLRRAGAVQAPAVAAASRRGDQGMSARPIAPHLDVAATAARIRRAGQRRRVNVIALSLSLAAMAFGLFWLIWILVETIRLGLGGLTLSLFTEMTPPPQAETGGLANAIFGSLTMVALATLVGTPIGILAGVYLAEYGQKTRLGAVTRFINDILLAAPSIVIGLFIYTVVVARLKSFSAIAGILALALIVIPIVIRTTENMLTLIPNALREAAYALGTPKWRVIMTITLKAALAGVITGVLLALARIAGETAPLLFTALSNQFWSSDLSRPMASLPVTIFKFAMSPYENWQKLAWVGVFLITLGVLLLNILARTLVRNRI
jgi:phosphate transport system permease protein